MLTNYLNLALRTLQKRIAFTFINVLGLCLGMTAFILIAQYVTFEKSYNGFHENLPNLYRVLYRADKGEFDAFVAPGFAPLVKSQLQGIREYCRVADGSGIGAGVVSFESGNGGDNSFREQFFAYADGNFFKIFSFKIDSGDPASLLKPNVVAISKSTSLRYFGTESSLGKTITLNNQFGKTLYSVEAIYEDMPAFSDLKYDLIFSLETFANVANLGGNESWAGLDVTGSQWLYSFVQLRENTNAEDVASQYSTLVNKTTPEEKITVALQPLSSMHLGRSMAESYPTDGSLRFVYLLSAIAAIILIIAWFNYVNLSTASALTRAKEVGIRKVVGASKSQLIRQFLGESLILNVFAFILSVALVNALQIPYTVLVGKQLSLNVINQPDFWLGAISVLVLGTLASGAYTAFVLSSFNPSQVLKGVFSKSTKGVFVRKSLVVVQFSISTMLIATTIILYQQWQFMQNKDLGMNANQLLVIRGAEVNKDDTYKDRSAGFEEALRNASFIQKYSRSGNVPTDGFNFATAGFTRQNPQPGDEKISYDMLMIDQQYLDTYEIDIVAGENFTQEMCEKAWNDIDFIMVNEHAARSLGFTSPVNAAGQKIKWEDRQLEIRGVVKDYHHQSVQNAIGPIIFLPRRVGSYYTVKLSGNDYPSMVQQLQKFYAKSFPGNPFEFQFLDQSFQSKYFAERQYSMIFTIASCLAILIGCLGLFGLATYSVEQRAKEIGIRKVLGSSTQQIVRLLSKDFLSLVSIAFIIAVPLSWYLIEQWLSGFAYRVDIAWWIYGIACGITLTIAWVTVGSRAFRGAISNPITSLRTE